MFTLAALKGYLMTNHGLTGLEWFGVLTAVGVAGSVLVSMAEWLGWWTR